MGKKEILLTHQVLTDLMFRVAANSIIVVITTNYYEGLGISLNVWVKDEKTEKMKSLDSYRYESGNDFVKAIESYIDSLIQSR